MKKHKKREKLVKRMGGLDICNQVHELIDCFMSNLCPNLPIGPHDKTPSARAAGAEGVT